VTHLDTAYDYAKKAWDFFKNEDFLNGERYYLIAAQYASELPNNPQAVKRTKEWDSAATRCRKLRDKR
jgi:hypothetical protein